MNNSCIETTVVKTIQRQVREGHIFSCNTGEILMGVTPDFLSDPPTVVRLSFPSNSATSWGYGHNGLRAIAKVLLEVADVLEGTKQESNI